VSCGNITTTYGIEEISLEDQITAMSGVKEMTLPNFRELRHGLVWEKCHNKYSSYI